MASMSLLSRDCLHTLATWGQALSCTRRNLVPTAQQHKFWQWLWRFYRQKGYCWLACRGLCEPPRIFIPRSSLTHCQTGHAGWCCGQHNIPHAISRLFQICHMSPVWTCSHPWRKWGANGGPANSGVLWQIPIKLHSAGLWAQVPLQGIGALMPPSWSLFLTVWSERCSPVAWILEGPGSAHPIPRTKKQMPLLLLGCCLSAY